MNQRRFARLVSDRLDEEDLDKELPEGTEEPESDWDEAEEDEEESE